MAAAVVAVMQKGLRAICWISGGTPDMRLQNGLASRLEFVPCVRRRSAVRLIWPLRCPSQ